MTRKTVIGLAYIFLGLFAVAGAAAMTYSSGKWFSSANELSVNVIRATFRLNETIPSVFINASLANPAGFAGLQLLDVNYGAYVNSTTERFQYLGTTSIGMTNKLYGDFIPSNGNMNISINLPV